MADGATVRVDTGHRTDSERLDRSGLRRLGLVKVGETSARVALLPSPVSLVLLFSVKMMRIALGCLAMTILV